MVEFMRYRGIAHLASPVVTEVKRAAGVLDWAVREMQSRYELLSAVGARDIGSYNKLKPNVRKRQAAGDEDPTRFEPQMPYIVIMVDELSDLMMVASKEVEYSITRLAQKSRATGIHLVLATQRPSVDVVTGLIKSNISCRVAFHVTARIDSSVILDRPGAEKLLGQGDMLFLSPGFPTPVRAKGVYLSDEEIGRVVEHIRSQDPPDIEESLVREPDDAPDGGGVQIPAMTVDALYHEAIRIVLSTQRGSVSLLQRRLGIGYTRAGKLIDMMAADGILGPYRGSKSRDINMTLDQWEESQRSQRKSA
jgi:S-DNA-T family DNA segregation ATPase FtsK/SpoIIIE